MTILVTNGASCKNCGGAAIDHKATGKNAAKWRRAVNVSQKCLAENGLQITQSFYSALELGNRNWTPTLVEKFESTLLPLMKEREIDVGKL